MQGRLDNTCLSSASTTHILCLASAISCWSCWQSECLRMSTVSDVIFPYLMYLLINTAAPLTICQNFHPIGKLLTYNASMHMQQSPRSCKTVLHMQKHILNKKVPKFCRQLRCMATDHALHLICTAATACSDSLRAH